MMVNKRTIFAGLIGLAVVGTAAVLSCSVFNKKRRNTCKFVKNADDVSVSVIDESTGDTLETTGEDILVPLEQLPAELAEKKGRKARPLTLVELDKIKKDMKGGRCTVMCIAKKYHLVRHQAYGIFYSIKSEVDSTEPKN